MAVRSRSLRLGILELALLAAAGAGVAVVASSDDDARRLIERERRAYAFVERVAAAERAFRAAGTRDLDRDGRPEYGTLADLEQGTVDLGRRQQDADGDYLAIEGYRVEVLLPTGLERSARTWGRSTVAADAQLASQTFAVVALPLRDGPRVLRGFYLDGDGYAYVAEGVYAADGDPTIAPPRVEMRKQKEVGGHDQGGVWRSWLRPPGAPPAR